MSGNYRNTQAGPREPFDKDYRNPAVDCRAARRRSAIEPVIGHIKAEHRMDRNYIAGEQGDAVNAVLAAAGYNFSQLLNWFRQLLWLFLAKLQNRPKSLPA